MPSTVAFFPWVAVRRVLTFGNIRLLPYDSDGLPGDLPLATQLDLDEVLKAYSTFPDQPVAAATLIEVGDWRTGSDAEAHLQALLDARELIALAALSNRRLFNGHFGYQNAEDYRLVIQRYQPGDAGRFAYTTRRRDGGTLNGWSNDSFAFHRPLHAGGGNVDVDEPLLAALAALNPMPENWRNAILDFNAANTDAAEMPEHTECVLLLCAFEWLFRFHSHAATFASKLNEAFPSAGCAPRGPLEKAWQKKYDRATRPLEAWAREFSDLRGSSAHGKNRNMLRFVWSMRAHLAFASMLFPLALKAVLAKAELLDLSKSDLRRIQQIDEYILHDPFNFDSRNRKNADHPWNRLDQRARLQVLADNMYAAGPDLGGDHDGEANIDARR